MPAAFSRGDNLVVILNSLSDSPGTNATVRLSGLKPGPRTLVDILFPTKVGKHTMSCLALTCSHRMVRWRVCPRCSSWMRA